MHVEITICTLDQRSIDDSLCYRTLIQELGVERANRWTEVVTIPLGADDT